MPARVLVLATPSAEPLAATVALALDAAGTRAEVALPDPRAQIDAAELVVALYDATAERSPRVQQALGYALARRAPVLAAVRGARELALLAERAPWPGGERSTRALLRRVQALLPATPRTAARSLASTSDARWHAALAREVEAELTARGWAPRSMADARVFVGAAGIPERVWSKRIGDARCYLRPRIAPFNPVDLLHVREADATRVFEWWVLRDSRPDAWMRRVYRGDSEKLTPQTKYFGQRDPPTGPVTRSGALLSQRFLTQRVDRTGTIAHELAQVEAWIAARAAPLATLA